MQFKHIKALLHCFVFQASLTNLILRALDSHKPAAQYHPFTHRSIAHLQEVFQDSLGNLYQKAPDFRYRQRHNFQHLFLISPFHKRRFPGAVRQRTEWTPRRPSEMGDTKESGIRSGTADVASPLYCAKGGPAACQPRWTNHATQFRCLQSNRGHTD